MIIPFWGCSWNFWIA